jgi:hypothetical protein
MLGGQKRAGMDAVADEDCWGWKRKRKSSEWEQRRGD